MRRIVLSSKTFKWLLVTAITLLAAFFRLYKIDVLPPGDMYDPAFYGLDALAILEGETPIYFPSNYGREPLFSYLVAACVALLGVGATAIHVASALVGIATVPAVYLAAQELFAGDKGLLRRYGGLAAALATALSFWHLIWSRAGVRAILSPLFASLVVWTLWRGLRTGRWRPLVGCGALLGLGMYTYQASYLLPVLTTIGLGYTAWRQGLSKRQALARWAAIAVIALLVFAPLGVYYSTHLESSLQRVREVHVFQQENVLGAIGQRVWDTVLAFGVQGDESPRSNLPGRPALNPALFAALLLGIAVSVRRIKQPAFFLLLVWLVLLCLPSILALRGEIEKRILGSLPAAMILITVGLLALPDLACQWKDRYPQSRGRAALAAAIACVALFGYSGVRTYHDYFHLWGEDPDIFTHFGVGLGAIGAYAARCPEEEAVYVSPISVDHPSVAYNAGGRSDLKTYHGNHCMVLPYEADHAVTYVIVTGEDRWSMNKLDTYLPQAVLAAEGPLHYQEPYFVVYRAPAGASAAISPTYPLEANWGDQIQLLGYDLAHNAQENRIAIRLYYRALSAMDTDYTVFVQLIGPHNSKTGGPLWSQYDSEPCRRYRPTSTWSEDEILIDEFVLPAPNDRPISGDYELIMGFYHWQTLERLPVLVANASGTADYIALDRPTLENTQ
jgi:4-amino-4-deoxy-L-arabinose transferase-like glycosyltransferase